jgi:hypothetical protein
MIGRELGAIVVDGGITKAPGGGEGVGPSPGERGNQGRQRSPVVAAHGLPEPMTTQLDRGDDSTVTRERLAARGLLGESAPTGTPAPIAASSRWPVERTTAHKTLVWCTERRERVIRSWLSCSAVIIIVRRLVRQGWPQDRWDDRPARRP